MYYCYGDIICIEGDMMVLVAYGILLLIYWNCPKYLKAAALVINFFVTDPIPYIDEFIMVAGLLASDR